MALPKPFTWAEGRQKGGYRKLLILTGMWPLPFDFWLLHYPSGSHIDPHRDALKEGRHFRLNVTLQRPYYGGVFKCDDVIFSWWRFTLFRPDLNMHSVSHCYGDRYVLSLGWLLKRKDKQ